MALLECVQWYGDGMVLFTICQEEAETYLTANYPKEETVTVTIGEGADKEEVQQLKPHWFLGTSKAFLSENCSNYLEHSKYVYRRI